MNPKDGYNTFDVIALLDTFLGLLNYGKNTLQHKDQSVINQKLDLLLEKVDQLKGGLTSGKD